MLYYITLYYIVLYYIMLKCIVLYCIILHHTTLFALRAIPATVPFDWSEMYQKCINKHMRKMHPRQQSTVKIGSESTLC